MKQRPFAAVVTQETHLGAALPQSPRQTARRAAADLLASPGHSGPGTCTSYNLSTTGGRETLFRLCMPEHLAQGCHHCSRQR